MISDHKRSGDQRSLLAVLAGVATAFSLLLLGCASDEDSSVGTGRSSDESASEDLSSQITEGGTLYEANCASCHGSDLRGTNEGPSHLSVIYEPSHHGDQAFRAAIANGVVQHHWSFGNMDPVPGLSPTDVDAIIAYVRAVQEREGFE